MHETATIISSTAVIIVGLAVGIIFNLNGQNRIEARLDRMQADMVEFFKMLYRHDEAIETLKKRG